MTDPNPPAAEVAFAYAGIGSRRTPDALLAAMADLAETLGGAGCVMSTGGADGADRAFETGALRTEAPVTVHAPWSGYNGYRPGREADSDIDVRVPDPGETVRGSSYMDLARRHHPAWERCGRGARALFVRNVAILAGAVGEDGDAAPVLAVVAYTPNGLATGRDAGGTGHGLRVARELGIPAVNVSPRAVPADNAAALDRAPETLRAALLRHFPALPG
ncbi:MAG: hypothetical protein OXH75_25515 [Acidobacteria bacterium]|nr:hypothetical protein [Acidobacteriota bacterium]